MKASRATAVAAAAVLVALSFALAACTQSIPRSGSVQTGLEQNEATPAPVIFTPSGPRDGQTVEEIVRGFTIAASSATDDYAIARKFLSPSFKKKWNPHAGVTIDETSRSAVTAGEQSVELTVTPTATVDEAGSLVLTPPSVYRELNYELERVDGQWRISSAPDGILLDRATFSLVFNQHPLYFVEPRTQALVPDSRWFSVGETAPGEIISQLLAGPANPVSDGVLVSAFPAGSALQTDAVVVENGKAVINFNAETASADADALALMRSQVGLSLASVVGITSAEFSVDSNVFATVAVNTEIAANYPAVNPRAVLQLGTELGELVDQTLISIGSWTKPIVAADPRELIIRQGNDAAVILTDAGLSWVDNQGAISVLDARANLSSPTLDRANFVWSSQQTRPAEVRAIASGGTQVSLATTWTGATEVAALRISRDGSRLAAIIKQTNRYTVQVAGVVRADDGTPVGLTQAVIVGWSDFEALDLDWVDANQIAVVTQRENAASQMSTVGLGQFSKALGTSPGVTTIAGANSVSELRALSSTGSLRAPQGVTWRQVVKNISLLGKRS